MSKHGLPPTTGTILKGYKLPLTPIREGNYLTHHRWSLNVTLEERMFNILFGSILVGAGITLVGEELGLSILTQLGILLSLTGISMIIAEKVRFND